MVAEFWKANREISGKSIKLVFYAFDTILLLKVWRLAFCSVGI